MKPLIVFILITLVFYSCTDKIVNKATSEENTGLSFSLDLSKAPIDVADVKGTLSRIGYDSIFIDFDISNNNAKAVINDIFPGKWHLKVEVYGEAGIIAYSGSTEAEVVSGTVTPVSVHLNPTTGGLDIVVTWGDDTNRDSSLIAYYPFNGNAFDESGNNYNGIVNSAVLTSDRFGNDKSAFKFDGETSYIDCGDILNDLEAPFTVSAWIKCYSIDRGHLIFYTDVHENFWESHNYHGLGLAHSNMSVDGQTVLDSTQLVVRLGDGNGVGRQYRRTKNGSSFLPSFQWIHVAAVVEGAQSMKLFLNGVDDGGTYSGSGGEMVHNSWHAYIGINFHGLIDDLRIYNKALSDEQILKLYQE